MKDPRVVSPTKSLAKRPCTKKQDIPLDPLDPFTLEPLVLTFENLFLLPEGTIVVLEPSKPVVPLKVLKLLKARKPPVHVPVSIVVILQYNKEGDIVSRIRDIIEIRSSRGRTIRLTDKRLAIRKKNK